MAVFVTQENPRVDIVSALHWGELDFSDDDWLLAMGDPAIIGIAFAIAASINHGRVNLLKWDKIERSYYPVKVNLRGGGIENLTPDEEKRT